MRGGVFVDCGAFDGDTVRMFKKVTKRMGVKNYNCVCFEPDADNFVSLKHNHPDVTAFNCGVWSETTVLCFSTGNGDASKVVDGMENKAGSSIVKIPVRCIDDIDECKGASFIKMDIEGSEQNALIGAKETIIKNRPKLAICIYHSDEDMIKIPKMIHEWVPEYRLYIRHHSNTLAETVLYATV